MKGTRVSVEEASPILGISPNQIRYLLRNNQLSDIGEAIQLPYSNNGRPRFEYHLYAPKILKRVGLSEWPEKKK